MVGPAVDEFGLPDVSGMAPAPQRPEGVEDMRALLKWKPAPEGGGPSKLQQIPPNAGVILEHDEYWRGVFRLNELTKYVEVWPNPLCPLNPDGDPLMLTDELVTETANWLARSEWDLNLTTRVVLEQIHAIARKHSYEPVQDYLRGLRWDGVPRLDTWLQTFLGVQETNEDGQNIAPYVRAVGRKWMISAVARAMRPGCKADCCLVLEGPQGLRKSSALDVLGGEWFTDTPIRIGDKDARMIAGSSWIVEMAELAGYRKADIESVKTWFSERMDKFRPPYGRLQGVFPRRCVFAGTVNPGRVGYLQDETGERRWWPVACTKIDIAALRAARDQLWAEATHLFLEGWPDGVEHPAEHLYWLTPEESAYAARETDARAAVDESQVDTLVAAWRKNGSLPEFSMADVLGWLDIPAAQQGRALETRIGVALKAAGFARVRRMIAGRRAYRYAPGVDLRALPTLSPVQQVGAAIAGAHVPQPPSPHTAPNTGDVLADLLGGPKGSA